MKRLLLYTNIYGEMVVDPNSSQLREAYPLKKVDILVYGFSLIRKELRQTPKTKKYLGRNLRIVLLSFYDEFVGGHTLKVDETVLYNLARQYYFAYKNIGGHRSEEELFKDYLIVACASQNGMDIVVSNDDSSMLSGHSLEAYHRVNKELKLKQPQFIDYDEFKALLLG